MTAGGGVDAFGSWPPGTALSVADLRQHLIVTRIAGDVATTRENNLRNFGLMSARDPGYLFGFRPRGPWTPPDVLALMHQRVGVQADPVHAEVRTPSIRTARSTGWTPWPSGCGSPSSDDNVRPRLYAPMTAYLLRHIS
ncbi:MAG: phosphatase [Actinomycetota bacterium]|nr:phosphatase [Actinomycetota bacterium]